MRHNNYGFYGSGTSGYVHYRQAMDESKRSGYSGKPCVSSSHNRRKEGVIFGKNSFLDFLIAMFFGILWAIALGISAAVAITSFYTFFVIPGYGIFDAILFGLSTCAVSRLVREMW